MTNLSVRLAGAIDPFAAASPAQKSAAVDDQSFANELSQTFAGARSKLGISQTDDAASQTNVARQETVTASNASGVSVITQPVATNTVQSADDAYWAAQPAAVQQLQNIDDPYQRAMLAGQLAAEGYSIDTPVMVWGWDPSKTTQLRESFGYTWVPSAMQAPITAAPGITGAGITPYDPNKPPPGSISV
jgi:hypothetical protein